MRMIQCVKLSRVLPGLLKPPIPGALGQRIFDSVSQEAWQMWLVHQTMLINEYRLNVIEMSSREFLFSEMDKFFFHGDSDKPPGYVEKK